MPEWRPRLDRIEEKRLLHAARRGDADSFAALYRANVQQVFRYIAYRVGDTQTADDLTSEVFMRALEGIAAYTDQDKPFLAWLYRIAHARVVDFYRRSGRRPSDHDLDTVPTAVTQDMDRSVIQQQAARALREAIASLTGDQQQVIILRFIEGNSIEATAQFLGKAPNAVKALQHRALRALARRLKRAGFELDEMGLS